MFVATVYMGTGLLWKQHTVHRTVPSQQRIVLLRMSAVLKLKPHSVDETLLYLDGRHMGSHSIGFIVELFFFRVYRFYLLWLLKNAGRNEFSHIEVLSRKQRGSFFPPLLKEPIWQISY